VAEDFLPGFWKEEGGGREGVDIRCDVQYGLETPIFFWFFFESKKEYFRAERTSGQHKHT
jgi:hypothetical protein